MSPSRRETRKRILEEAARLFHESGFSATSVATILREAEVNSGSLYHFFSSKEAVLAGVLERYLDLLEPTILEPVERTTTDPIERVFELLETYRRGLLVSGCTRGCPVGTLALEIGEGRPQVRALIDEYFSIWTGRVRRWLAEAHDRLPAELDRPALSRLVLAAMEGGVIQARAAVSLDPFDASVEQLRAYFGLLAAPQRPEAPLPPGPAEGEPSGEPAEPVELLDPAGWRTW